MTHRLLHLAALASHALPQVKFVALEEPQYMDEDFLLTGLADTNQNHWFVICPRHPQAGMELESQAAVMLALADNGARLPFRMPRPAGFAPIKPVGRALVHPALPGRSLRDSDLDADQLSLAKSLGAALASLHDMSINVAKAAGLAIYSGEEIRQQIRTKITQTESKESIPTQLQARWLERVEDASLWQFRPAFLHGALANSCLYTDGSQISGMSGFGRAHMGDPALDLSWVSANAAPEFYSHFLESYHRARPLQDSNLDTRIELHSEMALVDWLWHGLKTKQEEIVKDAQELLQDLQQVLVAKGEISESSPSDSVSGSTDTAADNPENNPTGRTLVSSASPSESVSAEQVNAAASAQNSAQVAESTLGSSAPAREQEHSQTAPQSQLQPGETVKEQPEAAELEQARSVSETSQPSAADLNSSENSEALASAASVPTGGSEAISARSEARAAQAAEPGSNSGSEVTDGLSSNQVAGSEVNRSEANRSEVNRSEVNELAGAEAEEVTAEPKAAEAAVKTAATAANTTTGSLFERETKFTKVSPAPSRELDKAEEVNNAPVQNTTAQNATVQNATSRSEAEAARSAEEDTAADETPLQAAQPAKATAAAGHNPATLPEDAKLAAEVAQARQIGQEYTQRQEAQLASPSAETSSEAPLLPGLKEVPDSPISNLLASFQDRLKTSAIDLAEMQAEADRSVLEDK